MLKMQAVGIVSKMPELKTSQKGTSYLKFQVEVPLMGSQWNKKVGVTVFGRQADSLASLVGLHAWVALSGEPGARGFLNKEQKPTGFLEMVADSVTILRAGEAEKERPTLPLPSLENVPSPSFDEADIPF